MTCLHVIELPFVVAPNRIVESIIFCLHAKPLVGVVGINGRTILPPENALCKPITPKLNGNMFRTSLGSSSMKINRRAIKLLVVDIDAGYLQDGWSEVRVRRWDAGDSLSRDSGPTDNKGDIDIRLKAACLAGVQSVLANVIAIVRGIKDKGILQHARLLKASNNGFNNFVYCLERSEAQPLILVVVVNDLIVKPGELGYPADAARRVGIEVGRPGDLVLWKQALMPLCNLRGIKSPHRTFSHESMRSYGCKRDEEG